MQDMNRFYRVTLVPANDPEDTRTLVMSETEIRDTYPHWAPGKLEIVSRDGVTVTVERIG